MKTLKIVVTLLLSSSLLAACGQDTKQLESFYSKVAKANKAEAPIIESNKNMQKLEQEKIKLFNKINKGKLEVINKAAKDLLENTKKRTHEVDVEEKAIAESKTLFESSLKEAKKIEDKTQKKEATDLIYKVEDKYRKHAVLMTGYRKIIKQETDIFKYLEGQNLSSKVVNDKLKDLEKTKQKFGEQTSDYTATLRAIEKEKKDIVKILNDK
ncbi:YkyA family protein [Macrococcus sp. DPC7161]|uniref:YkyA family protein n=1 Tax=Macrococcus sp. DPC7161 TaxID=2507060 RepID=UPI0013E8FEB1|nr:YkyA family protein [Macrococcus sp. DPC7161]